MTAESKRQLLNFDSVLETRVHSVTFQFLEFYWSVLIDELVDHHVASTNSHKCTTLLDLNVNSFMAEPVDAL